MDFRKRWFVSNEEIVGTTLEVGHVESHNNLLQLYKCLFFCRIQSVYPNYYLQ